MLHEVLLIRLDRTRVAVDPGLELGNVMRAYGRCSLDLRKGIDKIICDNRQTLTLLSSVFSLTILLKKLSCPQDHLVSISFIRIIPKTIVMDFA